MAEAVRLLAFVTDPVERAVEITFEDAGVRVCPIGGSPLFLAAPIGHGFGFDVTAYLSLLAGLIRGDDAACPPGSPPDSGTGPG